MGSRGGNVKINKENYKKLLKNIFVLPKHTYEYMAMTNYFKVIDKDKFNKIIERIKADVVVIHDKDKVSIISYDNIRECVPLEVADVNVTTYVGKLDNTLKLLQGIIPNDEVIIIQSAEYCKDMNDLEIRGIKVTRDKIIEFIST